MLTIIKSWASRHSWKVPYPVSRIIVHVYYFLPFKLFPLRLIRFSSFCHIFVFVHSFCFVSFRFVSCCFVCIFVFFRFVSFCFVSKFCLNIYQSFDHKYLSSHIWCRMMHETVVCHSDPTPLTSTTYVFWRCYLMLSYMSNDKSKNYLSNSSVSVHGHV